MKKAQQKRSFALGLFSLGLLLLCTSQSASQPNQRIRIEGNKVYTSRRLVRILPRYRRFSRGRLRMVKKRLKSYYHKRGYKHMRVYTVFANRQRVILYVDEGRFGKIIFHNVGAIDLVRMRAAFKLPGRVYHRGVIRREVKKLKKDFKLKRIYYRLVKRRDYGKAAFQLDRDLLPTDDPAFADFEAPSERYDLHVFAVKRPEKERGFLYGLRLDFNYGLIPWIKYRHTGLFWQSDRVETGLSLGGYYGLDLEFKRPPRWSWGELFTHYKTRPFYDGRLTPFVDIRFRKALEVRKDIGLRGYRDWRIQSKLGPGFKILPALAIDSAYGIETVFLTNPDLLADADLNKAPLPTYIDSTRHFRSSANTFWQFLELGATLILARPSLKHDIDRQVELKYDYFFGQTTFNRVTLNAIFDFEFVNFDIYSVAGQYENLFAESSLSTGSVLIPFYFEYHVDGRRFKGLLGRAYHTRHLGRLSNEYRTSLYKEILYGGLFIDMALFEGSGYDVSGLQFAFVGGISLHILIFDQLNFDVFVGRDYLLSNRSSQFDLYLSAFIRF